VTAEADPALRDDEAHVSITLADGTRLSKHVAHALGSVENPMTDRQLDAKFAALAHEVLDKGRRGQLLAACWTVDGLRDVSELARLSCPEPGLYRGSGA
jgi:2-methylcitrate dehydratase PrpD